MVLDITRPAARFLASIERILACNSPVSLMPSWHAPGVLTFWGLGAWRWSALLAR